MGLVKSVSIKVGHIVLTLMLEPPNSMAIDLVNPSTACLEALYTARSCPPTSPICDEILIKEPLLFADINLLATAIVRK